MIESKVRVIFIFLNFGITAIKILLIAQSQFMKFKNNKS